MNQETSLCLWKKKLSVSDFLELTKEINVFKIVSIDLWENSFESLSFCRGQIPVCVFERFVSLESVNISDNPIKKIDSVCFAKNQKLWNIIADNTQVKQLVSLWFLKNLGGLKTLSF